MQDMMQRSTASTAPIVAIVEDLRERRKVQILHPG